MTWTRRHLIKGAAACAALCACLPTRTNSTSRVSDTANQLQGADPFAAPAPGRVMVHLFEWRWDDVAKECESVLGPAGIYSVQVSPPNEHRVLKGNPWWQRYQPVSYALVSRSGDRASFENMVRRCRVAGVGVTVDAVINHMTSGTDGDARPGAGAGGSSYSKYNYPGLYSEASFHKCAGERAKSISSYQNTDDVQKCELVGLADLKTSDETVRATVGRYLADLAKAGVHGFRIDAAKHMPAEDIRLILNRAPALPNTFLEVIGADGEAVTTRQYDHIGRITEFRFSSAVADAIRGRRLGELLDIIGSNDWLPSDKALVFTNNHDNQRGHGSGGNPLTFREPELHDLAVALMLAHPYGQPSLMSSYEFSNADQGPPADSSGRTLSVGIHAPDATCSSGWVCEHRRRAVLGMVGFRNATAGQPLSAPYREADAGVIAFGRGNKGWFVARRGGPSGELSRSFKTMLPPGRYCDVISGGQLLRGRSCQGRMVEVDAAGTVNLTLRDGEAIALHAGARL